jgi:hypothetical protein
MKSVEMCEVTYREQHNSTHHKEPQPNLRTSSRMESHIYGQPKSFFYFLFFLVRTTPRFSFRSRFSIAVQIEVGMRAVIEVIT